jgi:hypothetical protein
MPIPVVGFWNTHGIMTEPTSQVSTRPEAVQPQRQGRACRIMPATLAPSHADVPIGALWGVGAQFGVHIRCVNNAPAKPLVDHDDV